MCSSDDPGATGSVCTSSSLCFASWASASAWQSSKIFMTSKEIFSNPAMKSFGWSGCILTFKKMVPKDTQSKMNDKNHLLEGFPPRNLFPELFKHQHFGGLWGGCRLLSSPCFDGVFWSPTCVFSSNHFSVLSTASEIWQKCKFVTTLEGANSKQGPWK